MRARRVALRPRQAAFLHHLDMHTLAELVVQPLGHLKSAPVRVPKLDARAPDPGSGGLLRCAGAVSGVPETCLVPSSGPPLLLLQGCAEKRTFGACMVSHTAPCNLLSDSLPMQRYICKEYVWACMPSSLATL